MGKHRNDSPSGGKVKTSIKKRGSPSGPRSTRPAPTASLFAFLRRRAQAERHVARDRVAAGAPGGADDIEHDKPAILDLGQLAPVFGDSLHLRPVHLEDDVALADAFLERLRDPGHAR